MEQVKSSLASTQRVDANGVVAQYIWSADHKEQEVSQGGKASNEASASNVQKGEVHDGTSPWESKEREASVGASP